MTKVFISHATADKKLANLVVNFLMEAIGVQDNDIFCSSIAGHGVPLTADFNDYIRNQIDRPDLVLILLTPAYFDSDFCLMELGAAWAKSLKTVAIITPDVSFEMVTKTLGLKQAWRINDHSRLWEIRGLFNALQLEGRSTATWESKCKQWKKRLPIVLKSLPSPETIARETHDAAILEIEFLKKSLTEEAERTRAEQQKLEVEIANLRTMGADRNNSRQRVLVVESELLVASDLEQILLQNGYDVIGVARTKEEALAAVSHRPDIILTETVLADGSSGLDFVNDVYGRLDSVAIFVTAYPERLLSAFRPEPVFLVTKPYTVDIILEELGKARGHLSEKRAWAGGRDRNSAPHAAYSGLSAHPVVSRGSNIIELHGSDAHPVSIQIAAVPMVDGMSISNRTDFDLIPHQLVIRAVRSDDGIDVTAVIQYRNRSSRHLSLSNPDAGFTLEAKVPDGQKSHGISGDLPKEKTDSIRFGTIRVYDERERRGKVFFSVNFGASKEASRSRMLVEYEFVVRNYPQDKSTDAVVQEDVRPRVTYYTKNIDE